MTHTTQFFDASAFVKVRCAIDGTPSLITWQGSMFAFVPGVPRQRLFRIVGMSIGRCYEVEDGIWDFASRELTYYLDPETQEILHTWKNPWTREEVPVMHVANNFVGGQFRGEFPAEVEESNATFLFDIFPTYPNPLADDPRFDDYSPASTYQAVELFKFTVPLADLLNPAQLSVSWLILSWDRMGPWLPWMKMGDRPGNLVYSACGRKVSSFEELPPLLQQELNTRVPLYKQPPTRSDQTDLTSWLYFQKHFDAYLRGDRFPIPEYTEDAPTDDKE